MGLRPAEASVSSSGDVDGLPWNPFLTQRSVQHSGPVRLSAGPIVDSVFGESPNVVDEETNTRVALAKRMARSYWDKLQTLQMAVCSGHGQSGAIHVLQQGVPLPGRILVRPPHHNREVGYPPDSDRATPSTVKRTGAGRLGPGAGQVEQTLVAACVKPNSAQAAQNRLHKMSYTRLSWPHWLEVRAQGTPGFPLRAGAWGDRTPSRTTLSSIVPTPGKPAALEPKCQKVQMIFFCGISATSLFLREGA